MLYVLFCIFAIFNNKNSYYILGYFIVFGIIWLSVHTCVSHTFQWRDESCQYSPTLDIDCLVILRVYVDNFLSLRLWSVCVCVFSCIHDEVAMWSRIDLFKASQLWLQRKEENNFVFSFNLPLKNPSLFSLFLLSIYFLSSILFCKSALSSNMRYTRNNF